MGEELSAATITTLYLITDKYRAILLAGSLQSLGKLLCSHTYATNTLYALYDASSHIALGKFLLPGIEVVKRKIGHVSTVVDRCDNLRIVGHLNSQ